MNDRNIPMWLAANTILRDFAEQGLLRINECQNGEVKVKYLTPEEVTEMIFGKYNMIPKNK